MKKTKTDLSILLLIAHIKSKPKLYESFNFSYKTQKYTLNEILIDIVYIMRTGISYRDLRSHLKWQTVYKVYRKLVLNKVFEMTYKDLLKKYYKRGGLSKKLRYISTDTTFIANKNGKDQIGLNKYYHKKKGNKISLIIDSNKKIINMKIYKGGKNDTKILEDQLKEDMIINNNDKNNKNILWRMQDTIQKIYIKK
jgi:hypothetical protein